MTDREIQQRRNAQRIVAPAKQSRSSCVGMSRGQTAKCGKPVFCGSKNASKIKTVKLDLLNKKDLNKVIKSKEFTESKIAEELIIDYISSVKQSSPAKKMLLINKEIFNKYIKNNSITTKEDVEKLFEISEAKQKLEEKIESLENCLAEEEYLRLLINYREWGKE